MGPTVGLETAAKEGGNVINPRPPNPSGPRTSWALIRYCGRSQPVQFIFAFRCVQVPILGTHVGVSRNRGPYGWRPVGFPLNTNQKGGSPL